MNALRQRSKRLEKVVKFVSCMEKVVKFISCRYFQLAAPNSLRVNPYLTHLRRTTITKRIFSVSLSVGRLIIADELLMSVTQIDLYE